MKNNLDIVYILDENFESVGVIDEYYSLIWTTRFRGAGEVQFELPATKSNVALLPLGAYLQLPSDPETLMVVETITTTSSFEEGNKLIISGHSLEAILGQRVADRINVALDANPVTIVKGLLNDNAVNSSNIKRNIPNLKLGTMLEDAIEDDQKVTYAVDGQNVYDVIDELLNYVDIGWKIRFVEKTKEWIFDTYRGQRRTYDQTDNPWVVFSPSYDNLISSNFVANALTKYNTVRYKGTEAYYDDGRKLRDQIRDELWNTDSEPSGLARREIFLDDSTGWQNPESSTGELYSEEEMKKLLKSNAEVALKDSIEKDGFDGEVDTVRQFTYGVDFEIGDICQMSTEYGIDATVRVEEVVQSMDGEGYKLVPTFIVMDFEPRKT